jgi:hypothetical protein
MNPRDFSFQLVHVAKDCNARRGIFFTPHGPVEMPAFMPVGTQATVKGLTVEQVRSTGAQMVLANTASESSSSLAGCIASWVGTGQS